MEVEATITDVVPHLVGDEEAGDVGFQDLYHLSVTLYFYAGKT